MAMLLTLRKLRVSIILVYAISLLARPVPLASASWGAQELPDSHCLRTDEWKNRTFINFCSQNTATEVLLSGLSLPTRSLAHLCLPGGPALCWELTREHQDACLQQIKSKAAVDRACREELESQQHWLGYREAQAAKSSITCCSALDAECECGASLADNAAHMPEDWAQEAGLLEDCSKAIEVYCPLVKAGQARIYKCLEQSSQRPDFNCSLPPIGGSSKIALGEGLVQEPPCKVAVISTYVPKNCGLATFTHALVQELRISQGLPQGCHVGVIALGDPADQLLYKDPIVAYDLRYDLETPSVSILEAVHFMHKASYTHVIIQQEFGVTPIMWQLADLARWLDPAIKVYTVVHNPRAAPNTEERGIIRALSQVSRSLIVMTWFGWHSLIAAYGIAPEKVTFIPHGVVLPQSTKRPTSTRHLLEQMTLPRLRSSANASSELPAEAQLVISNGLFTHYKRLDRIIAAMNRVLERHPATYFLLLGREHPSELLAGRLMGNALDQGRSAGVADRLLWVDGFQTLEALSSLLNCSAAFLAPFDEQSPTSGTLLMAMAHGLPIVATPTHHALELLYDSRGLLIPYNDNGTALAEALNALLSSRSLRSVMGARAQQMVHGWTWQKVAAQYAELISKGSVSVLGEDPFRNAHFGEPSCSWHGQAIKFLSGQEISAGSLPQIFQRGCMHALYIDVDIQVNAAVSDGGELTLLGISTQQWWLLMNSRTGIDFEFNPAEVPGGAWPKDSGLSVDFESMKVVIQSQNAEVHAQLTSGRGVRLGVTLKDRFAVPKGLLGQFYNNPLDLPRTQEEQPPDTDVWTQWVLPDQNLFSTDAPGQRWDFQFQSTIQSNVRWLPEHRWQKGTYHGQRQKGEFSILFRMEADIFGHSGIAQVNQRYWLQLKRGIELQGRHYTFDVCLVPQYLPREDSIDDMGVLGHLMFAAYKGQGQCIAEPQRPLSRWPGILFRFQWPPDFRQPMPGYIYIHQQDFEFGGIPKSWIGPMNNIVDEVWVPSQYNRGIFLDDGVREDRVKVLPHGIELTKYQLALRPLGLALPFNKSLVFLFNGGLLPRKGIDVLLQAYTEAFQPTDDVALIVHSSYGDHFWEDNLHDTMRNCSQPAVLFFQDSLSHIEMLRLYQSAHVYVSSFRSEGFGLGTLEALTMGLQVLLTDFGPSREVCPGKLEACTLVKSMVADCLIAPCNHSSLFGEETLHQPRWSEPSKDALVAALLQMYAAKHSMAAAQRTHANQILDHVRQWTWYSTGTSILHRFKTLLEG